MAIPALPQDFIGSKISIYIILSTPLIKSTFGLLFSYVVARVVAPGEGLTLFFRDLTAGFFTLRVESHLIGEINPCKRIFLIGHR